MFNLYPYLNIQDLNLDWIISHFKEFIDAINSLDEWRDSHEKEYEELKKLYDDIMAGNFPPAMIDAFKEWINANIVDIVGEAIKMIIIDLTDDGYLRITIPDSWDDIIFGTTGLDTFPAGVDYGHLTLTY